MTRIRIALSGGGHRASVWGAGLLLYLADVGRHNDVGVIASVSGGSITNAVVAHEMDYRQASAAEVRAGLRPLLRHIAYSGPFFWGPSTNLYVVTVLAPRFGLLGLAAGLIMAFITGLGIAHGWSWPARSSCSRSACWLSLSAAGSSVSRSPGPLVPCPGMPAH